jgi:hypothetical protein
MNNRPNVPEEIGLGKQYSWRASLKAGGGWMMLVFLTDLPGRYLIEHHHDWPLVLRALIAMIPLMASLLYVRSVARWVRGMDELHRRVTLEAFLFATVVYLFLSGGWLLLDHAGVWAALALGSGLHLERVPFSQATCTWMLCLTYVFFGVGYSILNRRYR